MSSFSSRMMRSGSRLTKYEYRDNLASTPENASADTAAPPTWSRRSSRVTVLPAWARYAAATRPLCPPPTMTTSAVLCSILRLYVAASAHGSREVLGEIVDHQPAALVEKE